MYRKYFVKPWQEPGEQKEAPHKRLIVPLFGPERRDVPEMNVNVAYIDPGSSTTYHCHVIGELICVITGRGRAILGQETFDLEPDVIFWAPKEVFHQVINESGETMKLITVFAPGMRRDAQTARIRLDTPPAVLRPAD